MNLYVVGYVNRPTRDGRVLEGIRQTRHPIQINNDSGIRLGDAVAVDVDQDVIIAATDVEIEEHEFLSMLLDPDLPIRFVGQTARFTSRIRGFTVLNRVDWPWPDWPWPTAI